MSDLLQGGDDVALLATATDEPDGVWEEVGRWPWRRLTAALVAAIGVIQADGPNDLSADAGHLPEATGHEPPYR